MNTIKTPLSVLTQEVQVSVTHHTHKTKQSIQRKTSIFKQFVLLNIEHRLLAFCAININLNYSPHKRLHHAENITKHFPILCINSTATRKSVFSANFRCSAHNTCYFLNYIASASGNNGLRIVDTNRRYAYNSQVHLICSHC